MPWPFAKPETAAGAPEAAARESQRPLVAGFVEALPDPALVTDSSGTVIAANPAVKNLLRLDPLGQHLAAAIRAPSVLDTVQDILNGGDAASIEFEARLPQPRQFAVHVAPVPWTEDSPAGALLVLRDLTREQQIERMRADFVANASHELRTPLASLSGFIETLLGAAKNDEAARMKFLGLMRSQAGRMKRLIDDLLSLSRIEMNEHLRPQGAVDLAHVAAHVADLLGGMAKEDGCEIRLDLEKPLLVKGDRDELVQVAQNLVENALKYGHAGKVIEITGRSAGGHAELSVRDYGPGIAEEHIPRLTERFYRVNVQESRSRGGTGLGLAIVKHILNRHHGKLIVTSQPGAGSTFAIHLPLYN